MTTINTDSTYVNPSSYPAPKPVGAEQSKSQPQQKAEDLSATSAVVAAAADIVEPTSKHNELREKPDAASGNVSDSTSASASKKDMSDAITKLSDFAQSIERDIVFHVDDESGRTIVAVIDKETKEVIREIPGEEALKLAEDIDQLRSLIFTARA